MTDAHEDDYLRQQAEAAVDALISKKVTEGYSYQWWIDLHEHKRLIVRTVLEAANRASTSPPGATDA